MDSKKELKVLSSIGKRILSKSKFSKIKKIKNLNERKELFLHSIKRELELKVIDFRREIKELYKQEREVFFIRVKINLLKHKIHYFIIEPNKKNFRKVMKLVKVIERDLKNV